MFCLKEKSSVRVRLLLAASLAVMAGPLGGCDMYAPGSLNEKHVQVQESTFNEDIALSEFTQNHVDALARYYEKFGGGVMDVTVTYDPRSYRNTAMKATQESSKIVSALRGAGVRDVHASILPIEMQGDLARVLISYDTYSAHAPDGCGEMPGMDGKNTVEYNPDYRLGCSIQSAMVKQVAHPKDLMGQGNVDGKTEGRSASNIIESYRYGSKNEPLDGESASGK